MLKGDGPRVGCHPGKMPDGIKLADCTYELIGIFEQTTISERDRASRAFVAKSAIGANMNFHDPGEREPYVARWYLEDVAKDAMIRALSIGQLPVWTDYDGQFVELDHEVLFGRNKWIGTHTVQSGTYIALNVAHGRDGLTRSECDGATLWVLDNDWSRARRALIDERARSFGSVLPWDISQLLREDELVTMNAPTAIGYTAPGNPMWTLYEAVAWLGSQDAALVDHQHRRHFPGTTTQNYGAVAWGRLVQSLFDRITNGAASMTADDARDRLIAACEQGMVQATGIPKDRSDRCAVPAAAFTGCELWEGRGGSLHRLVGGKHEAARWHDIRFRADDVKALTNVSAPSTLVLPVPDDLVKNPPVSGRELRAWVKARNADGWSQGMIVKGAVDAFPDKEVPGRPTLRELDADTRVELGLPQRTRGRDKKGG